MSTHNTDDDKIVYWHSELPPLSAELMAEHTLEATSSRVPGTISHRDELRDRCYLERPCQTSWLVMSDTGPHCVLSSPPLVGTLVS